MPTPNTPHQPHTRQDVDDSRIDPNRPTDRQRDADASQRQYEKDRRPGQPVDLDDDEEKDIGRQTGEKIENERTGRNDT